MDAAPDIQKILDSPIFSRFPFASGGKTQYADAMLRSTFSSATTWHTLLAPPAVTPLTITVPPGFGYLLDSRKSGSSLAVVDADFVQKELFRQLPRQTATLVVAVTHNATFYVDGDATICCSAGTHGVDAATGTSFILGSYFENAPALVKARDVQPLTQQLAEFVNDPLHNPQKYGYRVSAPGNTVPAWMPAGREANCGGITIGSAYFLLEPTDNNQKNNLPFSPAFMAQLHGRTYHLQKVALLPWYLGADSSTGKALSFPDPSALPSPAAPCDQRVDKQAPPAQSSEPVAHVDEQASFASPVASRHKLIGYWTGHGPAGAPFPLHEVSSDWDVVIVAFAAPASEEPEGTLRFRLPQAIAPETFKADVQTLKRSGRKVLLSLGGGGAFFSLNQQSSTPNFVSSVTALVEQYGFDGVDIDFETPSLVLQEGDRDFKHPTTPSIVNLIAGLRQLRSHFGPEFMLSLVPEGPQLPAGLASYGGQFGSYLPIAYALRDDLAFVDVQDYNSPPLQGLDGEPYQSHTVNYHAALTELLLKGFLIGGDPSQFFPPLPADKVAIGFLTSYEDPAIADAAINYLLTGKATAGATYRLQSATGYAELLGAMFWTIDDDRQENYRYSRRLGSSLHRSSVRTP